MIDDIATKGVSGVEDIPDLTGARNPKYLVPDGLHRIDKLPGGIRHRWVDGVKHKWDVSRQIKVEEFNPKLLLSPTNPLPDLVENWPGGPDSIAGNDVISSFC